MSRRIYNHLRDAPEHRARAVQFAPCAGVAPAARSDLSAQPFMPSVWNQGDYGTCAAHAGGAFAAFTVGKLGLPPINPSRLLIYWFGRVLQGTTNYDSGCSLANIFRALAQNGFCDEALFPYPVVDNGDVPVETPPPAAASAAAAANLVTQEQAVAQDLDSIRQCLTEGWPLAFGFQVWPQFESAACAQTGLVDYPGWWTRLNYKPLGWHGVLIVGHDDAAGRFKVRNSWGPNWGDAGHFYLPYEYVADTAEAADFWTARGAT